MKISLVIVLLSIGVLPIMVQGNDSQLDALVDEFETHLTQSDLEYITQDNPRSFYRITGMRMMTRLPPKCTHDEYLKLRKAESLTTLAHRAMPLRSLLRLYELVHQDAYLVRIRQLISRNPDYAKFKPLIGTKYRILTENDRKKYPSSEKLKSILSRTEEVLKKLALPKNEQRAYLTKLLRIAPNCFRFSNIEMDEFLRQEITTERGKCLLESLERFITERKKLPQSVEEIPVKKDDFICGYHFDEWGHEYQFIQNKDFLQLKSLGSSPTDSNDDMVIGEIWHSSKR